MADPQCWALLPAAGSGSRMREGHSVAVPSHLPKQYLPLAGRRVIEHALAVLLDHPLVAGAVVVLSATDRHWQTLRFEHAKPVATATGGNLRYLSVQNGLRRLATLTRSNDWVLVHDAARPCLRRADLDRLIETVQSAESAGSADQAGGLLATPVRDTMKRGDAGQRIVGTVSRDDLWHALTPQMFRLATLERALEAANQRGQPVTDEAGAVESLGLKPLLVPGSASNIKITRPEDLALAEFYLSVDV